MKKILSKRHFKVAMTTIEKLLEKATKGNGFHTLTDKESEMLGELSKQVEDYEDNTLHVMPLKPKSIFFKQ